MRHGMHALFSVDLLCMGIEGTFPAPELALGDRDRCSEGTGDGRLPVSVGVDGGEKPGRHGGRAKE